MSDLTEIKVSLAPRDSQGRWQIRIHRGVCVPPEGTKFGRVHSGPDRDYIIELWTYIDPSTGDTRYTGVVDGPNK